MVVFCTCVLEVAVEVDRKFLLLVDLFYAVICGGGRTRLLPSLTRRAMR